MRLRRVVKTDEDLEQRILHVLYGAMPWERASLIKA
jgi:hypothetical protein